MNTSSIAGLAVIAAFAAAAPAEKLPEAAAKAGITDEDWRVLTKGDVVTRLSRAAPGTSVTFVEGAVIVHVPWEHAFEEIGDLERTAELSTCLHSIQVLMRTQSGETTKIKTRETHQSLWMKARYTLDYEESAADKEIRWTLDPAADNDVTRMSGSWRFVPLDERTTLLVYRVSGSQGRALPHEVEEFFGKMMVPDFVRAVRAQVEDEHARGRHH